MSIIVLRYNIEQSIISYVAYITWIQNTVSPLRVSHGNNQSIRDTKEDYSANSVRAGKTECGEA